MPKRKPTQKQKQKQTQKTVVNVKVGDTVKKRVSRRPRSAPAPRMPSGISVTLQGSNLSLPAPPLEAYNAMLNQAEALRRQMALSGQLIPQRQTNDLLNRIEATNPFANVQNVVPVGSLMRPEQLQQQVVEDEMTQNAYESRSQAFAQKPLDQDWIRNVAIANKGQNLFTPVSKVIASEDVETASDISQFDDQNRYEQGMLERQALREQMKVFQAEQEEVLRNMAEQQGEGKKMSAMRAVASLGNEFKPSGGKKGRPKKMPPISPY